MTARKLICIASSRTRGKQLPDTLPGWEIKSALNLVHADRILEHGEYRVGLIAGADARRLHELGEFLGVHNSIQWVGVFPGESMKIPAYRNFVADHLLDYYTAPADPARLSHTLGHALGWAELSDHRAGPKSQAGPDLIAGKSAEMRRLRSLVGKVAKVQAPVLICGESGSGKELTAQAVHALSPQANGPFVPVNCGAIPAALIQSELFGYERGAFTGAASEKAGLIESAKGGTIFLDEIADLPLDLQVNLLRFLQEGNIYRIGATRAINVNARVVAASHVNLQDAVAAGRFREDLFYRLNVLPISVPPLRARKADISDLAMHFFTTYSSEKSPRLKGFTNSALQALEAHHWPGNVRELINRVRRAMVLAEGRLITPLDLGFGAVPTDTRRELLGASRAVADRDAICASLDEACFNITRAAQLLGVSRMTLYRMMAKHGIAPPSAARAIVAGL
jgi:DNA-binding NtrC family response regulator